MAGLDELLTFPMDEDIYEGTGGGNILDEPYILLQRDKQTAEQEQTVPLILTSDPKQQSVKSLKALSAANIDAINGLTALKLFMTPSDVPNELQQYIYNNQNIINQPYTSIQELIPKQILFICLCHQICFYSPMSFRKTFPEKFRSARNILNTRTLELDLFWGKLTNALGVTDIPLKSMLDEFSKSPSVIKTFLQEDTTKPENSLTDKLFGKTPVITLEMEQKFNELAKTFKPPQLDMLSKELNEQFRKSGKPFKNVLVELKELGIQLNIQNNPTVTHGGSTSRCARKRTTRRIFHNEDAKDKGCLRAKGTKARRGVSLKAKHQGLIFATKSQTTHRQTKRRKSNRCNK